MKPTAYITTSISYANAKPHIGHALEWVQADFLARALRADNFEVRLLTGTDEHGLKVQQAATKEGSEPKIFVQQQSLQFQSLADKLDISYQRFIRTTDQDHLETAQAIWKRCQKNGDIYKRRYQAWYDTKEETFLGLVSDFPDPSVFGVESRFIEQIDEENYFFRLSKYQEDITSLLKGGELKITPFSRAVELLNFIADKGLEDISISRDAKKLAWGIPVPDDQDQVMYVWFDALTNYLTASSKLSPDGEIIPDTFWPPTLHCVGKDIQRFHSLIWPAMLRSAGLPLPKEILVHGFIVAEDGRKMSKSLGNVIDPSPLVDKYGSDVIRWFLLKEISTTDDARLSEERIKEVYNADLANTIGNLVSRLATMAERYLSGRVLVQPNAEMQAICESAATNYDQAISNRELQSALHTAFALAVSCNRSIEEFKPWQVAKNAERNEELATQLGAWFFGLAQIIRLIAPAIPQAAAKLGWLTKEGEVTVPSDLEILFPRR